jgi:outer membrane protein, multidrug efflux system
LTVSENGPQTLTQWWTTLGDPLLSDLVKRAVHENLNLKEAEARVREARGRRGIASADLFPALDASASASRGRGSEQTGSGETLRLYQAGFDAVWELDLFGGVRRSIEAADADLAAARESLSDVWVSLTAEVALNYVDVRAYQARIAVARSNLRIQEETLNISSWRYQAGLASQLDVEQATYNMEETRSQIPALQTGLEQALNRMAVLLGSNPGGLHSELEQSRPIPVTPLEIAVGVPADTLRRRPDVRKAERELAGQTAQVGVATAELYPKFSLTGSIGLESLSSADLFDATSRTRNVAAGVSWPVFKAGAIMHNIDVQSAIQEQKLIAYKAAILAALEDVENAMTAYGREQHRRGSLKEAALAARRAVALSRDQYASGLIDFQTVLESERALLSFEDQLTQSEQQVTANLISLYKALGGGWSD